MKLLDTHLYKYAETSLDDSAFESMHVNIIYGLLKEVGHTVELAFFYI